MDGWMGGRQTRLAGGGQPHFNRGRGSPPTRAAAGTFHAFSTPHACHSFPSRTLSTPHPFLLRRLPTDFFDLDIRDTSMSLHHQHEPPAGKTKPQHNSTGKTQRTPAGPCPPLGKHTQQAGGPLKNGTAPRRNAHFPLGGPGSGDGNPGGLKVKAAARRRRPPSPYLTPDERDDWRTQDGLMAGWGPGGWMD